MLDRIEGKEGILDKTGARSAVKPLSKGDRSPMIRGTKTSTTLHSSQCSIERSDDEFESFPLSQSDLDRIDKSVNDCLKNEKSHLAGMPSLSFYTLQKSQFRKEELNNAHPSHNSVGKSRPGPPPLPLSTSQSPSKTQIVESRNNISQPSTPKSPRQKGQSFPASANEEPREKRRFFIEKEADLFHAAIDESRRLYAQEQILRKQKRI